MIKRKLHFNRPQLRSMIIGAPVEYLVAGRGTGKSEGVLAPKSAKCYLGTMPRSTGVAVGATYNQLLTRTLPALIAGWERLGYRMGKHYLVGQRPTEKWKKMWKWEGPYRPPLDYKYFISWWNGAGAHMVSQDRTGSANGITIDWIIGDELKLLNAEKLKTELFPANRGIIPAFSGNPYHHGMTFTTDMPVGTAGRWILDMAKKMDSDRVKQILTIQKMAYHLRKQSVKARKPQKVEISKQLEVLEEELMELRKGLLYYHEASTLENIHALGVDYIKQQLRDTTTFQFDTQILNIKPRQVEEGFYPDFDEEKHGYFAADNSYLDNLGFDLSAIQSINCLRDADRDNDAPLHITLDYNRRIHPLVVGQVYDDEMRILKGLHSLYPLKLKDVMKQFNEYYAPHKRRLVYYWYDHTAVADDNESRKCDEVMEQLKAGGWVVIPMYIGQAPSHEVKYRMYGHIFTESGKYTRKLTMNRENCDDLITSIGLAPAEQRKDGFGKDKSSEKDPNFPANESTHYSDALDTLVYGVFESGLPFGSEPVRRSIILTR